MAAPGEVLIQRQDSQGNWQTVARVTSAVMTDEELRPSAYDWPNSFSIINIFFTA